jgi:hypothetical protein
MIDMTDEGEFCGAWMAHKTNVPLRDAFPSGWMGIGWGGCSRLGSEDFGRS